VLQNDATRGAQPGDPDGTGDVLPPPCARAATGAALATPWVMTTTRVLTISLGAVLALAACGIGTLGNPEDEDGLTLAPDPALETERDPESQVDEEELPPADGEGDRAIFSTVPAWLDGEELAFLKRINDYRAAKGKGKLRVSIALTRASSFHSADMASKDYFSHTSADGTSFADRVKRYYNYNPYLGENIAMGYTTGDAVFAAWKASPGHDANMLRSEFSVIGISRVANADGAYYWTTDFGGKRDAILSAGISTLASNAGFASAVTAGVAFSSVRTLNRWHTHASSGGSSAVRAASASAGSYGLRQVDPDPGNVSATQLVLASHGVNYRIGVNARRLSGATQQVVYLDFINKDFGRIKAVTVAAAATSSWQTITVGEVAPSGTRYVRAILWGSGTSGHKSTCDFDVVRLEAF
jgi:uncharacterized protein YkwD